MVSADILVTGQRGYRHHADEAELRAAAAAHRATTPAGLDVWVVTAGLAQTRAVLTDPRLSKDARTQADVIPAKLAEAGRRNNMTHMYGPSMLNSDPPAHSRLRGRVASAFTPARVRALQPWVEQEVKRLVDFLPTPHEIDLIASFAFELPLAVISELLGVPVEDRSRVHQWTSDVVLEDPQRTVPASEALSAYLQTLIEFRRARPDEGLLSALLAPGTDGTRLSDDELMAMLFVILIGGHETVTGLIGNTVYALLREPRLWRAVAADPDLAEAAVEETLRLDPPTRNTTHRITVDDLEIGDTRIPSGEVVLVSLSTAGRDPETADRPDEFDLDREKRQHASFGHGIHFCPGTLLARLQAQAAVRELTQRFPDARLAEPEPRRQDSAILGGLAELPVFLH